MRHEVSLGRWPGTVATCQYKGPKQPYGDSASQLLPISTDHQGKWGILHNSLFFIKAQGQKPSARNGPYSRGMGSPRGSGKGHAWCISHCCLVFGICHLPGTNQGTFLMRLREVSQIKSIITLRDTRSKSQARAMGPVRRAGWMWAASCAQAALSCAGWVYVRRRGA